jgi:hypothetical protein
VALATQEGIRDRVIALIEALVPSLLSSDRFRSARNEYGADFQSWADQNPAAAWRRFQVREVGDDAPPEVSSITEERVRLQLELVVAYPQGHRAGPRNAMDRDDAINADWKLINAAIGMYGRANFSGAHDCTPLGATKTRDAGQKVDFLVVRAQYEYQRAIV